MSATDLRRGVVIKIDGDLFVCTGANHNTPGNWRGMVQADL
ncbi:MAG: elongation factor P, partial [Planctomycetota bacterium]